ncbi:leishmanolysin-related zinc metalloendopeptidase [Streptomyces erythrochromogenes]|uniref:leishmanolysin-related zinc metalloendopeptidase n=1 Tax=Streptomyces erythrochromogenes TaxID=285574 RepID=UPI0034395E52
MTRHPTYAFESYTAVASATRAADLAETTSPFQIEVRFVGGLTNNQKDVFAEAAERWARVIVGDLETAIIRDFSGELVIDDLLIDAEGVPIDGEGGILGAAGPVAFRSEDAAAGANLPAKGIMRFDTADLNAMEDDGTLLDVITHEMGHVLGITKTVWREFGLLKDFPGPDPTFVGTGAAREFGRLVGTGPTPVPVANVGGEGSAGSHWRESLFGHELMSPNIGIAGNPTIKNKLSRLTVASLGDLGYQIDLDGAEDYELPTLLDLVEASASASEAPRGVVLPTVPSRVPADRP